MAVVLGLAQVATVTNHTDTGDIINCNLIIVIQPLQQEVVGGVLQVYSRHMSCISYQQGLPPTIDAVQLLHTVNLNIPNPLLSISDIQIKGILFL